MVEPESCGHLRMSARDAWEFYFGIVFATVLWCNSVQAVVRETVLTTACGKACVAPTIFASGIVSAVAAMGLPYFFLLQKKRRGRGFSYTPEFSFWPLH